MTYDHPSTLGQLLNLIKTKSKHSDYQLLYPTLSNLLSEADYRPSGKYERERQSYMIKNCPLEGLRILDIGANTGYFSLAALDSGALHVTSQEGNAEHAEFIALSASCLAITEKILVCPSYFDFSESSTQTSRYDLILCLNVLHHLGDDFGDGGISLDAAKSEMINSLNRLSKSTKRCWMQLGFNWKGDRYRPLFKNGTKQELIEFVKKGIKDYWAVEKVAVFNPISKAYEDVNTTNLARFDQLGEFLNRPLFLLKSQAV